MIFRADYEHGAVGMRNDRVGDGSHQSPLERAQSPASQNDEVGAELLGRPNNLLGGNPDGRREVALGTGAFEALRKHRARQSEERLMLGSLYENLGLVFATAKGTPLEASNIDNRSFKPLLSGAGITPIKFHELRHTCASLMASADVPPSTPRIASVTRTSPLP
jgi:hypothetical protein